MRKDINFLSLHKAPLVHLQRIGRQNSYLPQSSLCTGGRRKSIKRSWRQNIRHIRRQNGVFILIKIIKPFALLLAVKKDSAFQLRNVQNALVKSSYYMEINVFMSAAQPLRHLNKQIVSLILPVRGVAECGKHQIQAFLFKSIVLFRQLVRLQNHLRRHHTEDFLYLFLFAEMIVQKISCGCRLRRDYLLETWRRGHQLQHGVRFRAFSRKSPTRI